jgi:DMSO/TMAO reductase YedYZ molybdopterin-dependent catalytic subunit
MLSQLHWVPSAIAAGFTIALAIAHTRFHKPIAYAMAFFAIIGLIGYVDAGSFEFTTLNIHTIHAWLGTVTLIISLYLFVKIVILQKRPRTYYLTASTAGISAAATLLLGGLILMGYGAPPGELALTGQVPASSTLPEVEATAFQGVALTPLSDQLNNAIQGTQHIDRETYTLQVTGLVENQLNPSYDELLAYPAYSEVVYMPCVEGWGFTAKWTGFRVTDLLDDAQLKPEATYVVFHSSDGYSTGLYLDYLRENDVLLAYGINDVTLPADRGFPFQLVAKSKYGYKWGKWITRIEVTDHEVLGFWEQKGYSDTANVGEPPFR